jgi:hypothetical protein
MGWTSTYKTPGQSMDEFFMQELFTGLDGSQPYEIVASAFKNRVWYAAVKDTKTGDTVAMVVLVTFAPRDSQFNITYKDMTEEVGPCERECPNRILDLLTPIKSEWANQWRADCREYNRIIAERKARQPKRITDGMRIKLAQPVRFRNGAELDEFTVEKRGRKTMLRNGYTLYRLNLRKYDFTEVRAA